MVTAMRILLEDGGHRVSSAATAARAETICREDPPRVMLLDLRLPDGDGLELLERLGTAGIRPPVVLALTGRDDPGVRTACMQAGCRDVVLKPFDTRKLVELVGALLAGG